MFTVFALITAQALLGALDNLWHREITERLPAKRSAAAELTLHAARELIYAFVFIGLAWVFTVFGVGVFAWSLRNVIAVVRLRKPPEWARNPVLARWKAAPRTVLVTGATGFIGGHLVRKLTQRGDHAVVLTRDADHALDRFGPH